MDDENRQSGDNEFLGGLRRKVVAASLQVNATATAALMTLGVLFFLFSAAGAYAQGIPEASISEQEGQDFPGNYTTPGWLVLERY